jgi:hypothetical protein
MGVKLSVPANTCPGKYPSVPANTPCPSKIDTISGLAPWGFVDCLCDMPLAEGSGRPLGTIEFVTGLERLLGSPSRAALRGPTAEIAAIGIVSTHLPKHGSFHSLYTPPSVSRSAGSHSLNLRGQRLPSVVPANGCLATLLMRWSC